jgi:hypothetical protein
VTTTTPSREAVADVLDKAADHIDRVGLHKGYLYDTSQADAGTPLPECRVCALGGINAAAFGTPRYSAEYNAGDEPLPLILNFAQDAVARHLGGPSFEVDVWNDKLERTQDDVTTALRATATSLRGEATA